MNNQIIDLDQRLEEFYQDCPEARGHGVHISCLLTAEELEQLPTVPERPRTFNMIALS